MRRADRETTAEYAAEIIDRSEYGVMSVCDGTEPYGIPLSAVRDGEWLYFHCAAEGRKTDILRRNPKVSIVFVGYTKIIQEKFTTDFESAVVSGTASEVVSDEEKLDALEIICSKLTPDAMEHFSENAMRSLGRTAIWKIHIDSLSGKRKITAV